MRSSDRLAEQHILEHQVRQQRLAELEASEHAEDRISGGTRLPSGDDWRQTSINEAGPMGLLDVVAQDLETFVELFDRAGKCDLPTHFERS